MIRWFVDKSRLLYDYCCHTCNLLFCNKLLNGYIINQTCTMAMSSLHVCQVVLLIIAERNYLNITKFVHQKNFNSYLLNLCFWIFRLFFCNRVIFFSIYIYAKVGEQCLYMPLMSSIMCGYCEIILIIASHTFIYISFITVHLYIS